MTQEKPLIVSPKRSVPLGCLPASNRWPLTCSRWPCSCKHCKFRPPTDPHALLPGSQGTLWHTLSLFLSTLEKGTCTQQPVTVGDAYKMHRLLHRGAEDGKRHPVYNARTLPPGEDTDYSNYDFHDLSRNVDTDTIISSNLQTMGSHVWSSEGSFTNTESKCVVTCCPSTGVGPIQFQTSHMLEKRQAGLRTH